MACQINRFSSGSGCQGHSKQALATATQVTPTPTHIGREPKSFSTAPFSGRKDEAMEFLLKCDMVFDVQPASYATNKSKIAFVANLLKDEAYRWVMPHLGMDPLLQPL